MYLHPVLLGEGHGGLDVGLSLANKGGEFGDFRAEFLGYGLPPLGFGRRFVVLSEGGCDKG